MQTSTKLRLLTDEINETVLQNPVRSKAYTESTKHFKSSNSSQIATIQFCHPIDIGSSPFTDSVFKQCDRKNCNTLRIELMKLKSQFQEIKKDRDLLKKELYIERQKLGRKVKSIEIITDQLDKKTCQLYQQEITLNKRTREVTEKEQETIDKIRGLYEIENQVTKDFTELHLKIESLKQNEILLLDRRAQLEQNVKHLEIQHQNLSAIVEDLKTKEIILLNTIEQLSQYIQNSQFHFDNLNDLDKRLREKCIQLEDLQPEIAKRFEQQELLKQNNYLNTLGNQLNEEVLQKTITHKTKLYSEEKHQEDRFKQWKQNESITNFKGKKQQEQFQMKENNFSSFYQF